MRGNVFAFFRRHKIMGIGLIILLIAVGIIGFLHTPPGRDIVFNRVKNILENKYGLELTAGSLRYNLFNLSASVDRLQINTDNVAVPLKHFSAENIGVNVGIRTFLSGMLHFQNIKIGRPYVILRLLPPDTASGKTQTPDGLLRIRVDNLNLERGRIEFEDKSAPIRACLSRIRIDIHYDPVGKYHSGLFSTEKGSVDFRENQLLIDHIQLPFRFDNHSIELQDFQLESPALNFKASGKINDFQTSPVFDLRFSASVRSEILSQTWNLNPSLLGTVKLEGRLYSSADGPGLEGSLAADNFAAGGVPVSSVRAVISYELSRLELSQLILKSRYGELTAEGTWFPDAEGTSRINISWNKLQPGQLLAQVTSHSLPVATESRGRIQAEWIRMDPAHLNARLDAEFGSFSEAGRPADLSGRLKADWNEGTAVVHPSRLSFPGGEFSLNGRVDSEQLIQARMTLRVKEFSRVVSRLPQEWRLEPVHGGLDFAADFQGKLSQPRISLDINSQGLSFRELDLSQLTAGIKYDHHKMTIREGLIQAEEGKIQISGEFDAAVPEFSLGESIRLDLSMADLALAPVFGSFLPSLPVEGQLNGTSSLSGSFQNPQISFKLRASPLKISDENVDSLFIEGTYRPEKMSLKQLEIIKNGASLSGSGEWKPGWETFELDLIGKGIRIQDFTFFSRESQPYSGEMDFQVNARGPLARLEGRLNLTLTHANAGDIRVGKVLLEAQADGDNLSANLHTEDRTIQIQAQMPLNNPRQIQTQVDINQWDLGFHLPPKPGSQGPMPPFSTLIDAASEMTIPLDAPLLFSADFHMNSLRFAYRGVQFTLHQPISLSAENGIISIQDFIFSGPQTEIRASGRFPIWGHPQPGISLSGKLNLRAFEPFIPGAHLNGTIDLKTLVSGTLQNPELSGNIRMAEVEAGYSGLPYSLEKMGGEIILDTGLVRLKNFSAVLGEGKIEAEGQFEIPGLHRASLSSENNRLSLRWADLNPAAFDRYLPPEYSGQLNGEISGNIAATGDFSSLRSISVKGRFNRFRIELIPFQIAAEEDIIFSMSGGFFRLQSLRLSGSQSSIQAQGSLDLNQEEPQIAGSLAVSLDGGSLSPFTESALLSGTVNLNLSFNGPIKSPAVTGTASLQDVYVQLQRLPLTISNLEGDINFSDSTVDIPSLNGSANGGPLSLSGKVSYRQFSLEQAQLDLNFQQMQWNYPEGLNSFNQGNLSLLLSGGEWTLSGDVRILQAYFKKDIYIGTELVNQIRLNRVRMQTEMPDFLKKLNVNIRISTESEAVIDNNLAEIGLNANLIIKGNPINPVLSGLVSNPFSGEIIFGERRFQVETVRIDFPGGDILDARVNINAHTTMRHEYQQLDITLVVSGPLTDLRTSLTSFPARSEVELAALLITGRSVEDLKSGAANIIGNQLLLHFTTPLTSTVTGQIENWLQAEEIRIEPINISTEEDPGARFTFRKGLIQDVDLIYSVDITNTQDQTWIMEYDLSRSFTLRAFRKDDGSYGSSLEHRFGLGRPDYAPSPVSETGRRRILEAVRFSGELGFPEGDLRRELGTLKPGRVFNYSDLQSAVDSLTKLYTNQNYLNAVINPRISHGDGNRIQVDIHIQSGKPVFLDFRGDLISNDIRRNIRRSWSGRLPEAVRISEASKLILTRLKGKGYYQAEVSHATKSSAERIQHTFTITQGTRFKIGRFIVEGGGAVTKKEIRKTIQSIPESQDFGLWNLVRNFPQVQQQLEKLYEEKGYMNARIHPPKVNVRSEVRRIDITLAVKQGEQSRVESLDFKGLEVFTPQRLKESLNLVPGRVFRPSQLALDINHLIDQYRSRGFQDVEISAGLEYQKDHSAVRLTYTIAEGIVHHIQDMVISGNRRTPEKVIRRELVFKEGDPVVQARLVESQKNLYDLNIFELVNIQRKKIPDRPGSEQIQVEVREMPLFYLGYGLRYNSEDKVEGFGNIEFNNLFGRSRNGILYYRQNQWEKNFRFSMTAPYFLGLSINTLHSFFLTNEERAGLVTNQFGYTVEQKLQLPFSLTLAYLYRLSHIHTYDVEISGPFAYDFSWWLSEVSTNLFRDTRSDKLNARTGSFFSLSLTYSPKFLGSTFTYIRGFGQYSFFLPLSDNLTWASNLRIGLGETFEQTVMIRSKRFFAGGGNSIRGFEKDQVGPYSRYLERPDGGEALFIINQELRFPIYKGFSGVAFFDAGNVYRYIEEFKPWDLRTGAGLGLRFNSPVGLLRLDCGFNLAPEEREPRTVVFFSIGQAF